MTTHIPARDGRSTDTHDRILRAAEQLYYAGGYEHINLQVIADQVGVSKTALFHHFKSKQELFYATLLRMLARYHEMFAEALDLEGQGVRQRLRHIMVRLTEDQPFDMMRFAREEYVLLSPEQQVAVERGWRAGLYNAVHRLLEDGVRRGELRPIDLALSTYVFMHLCMLLPHTNDPIQRRLAGSRGADDMPLAIDALLDLYLNGVSQPAAETSDAPDAR
jgi:AcrR family transcriptional regulator